MPDRAVRVLIADDHESFRGGVRATLAEAGIEVVAEAATGTDAVRLAVNLELDAAVLDVRMPELDGLTAAARILTLRPRTAIVMLSLSRGKQHVLRALASGVKAYVAKDDALECLADAIRAVTAGKQFLSSSVIAELRRTEEPAFSAEARREALALYDREAPPLFHCARAAADSDDHARDALRRSFLAYLVARNSAGSIQNPRSWLLVSTAAFLFEHRQASGSSQPAGKAEELLFRIFTGGHAHPGHAVLARYWRGAIPGVIRSQLRRHVSGCPSCHFEWSLIAFTGQYGGTMNAVDSGEVSSLRSELVRDLETGPVVPSLLALAARDARVRELVASDLQVLLGSAAVREWKQRAGSGLNQRRSPLAWTTDFLGQGAAPFVETLLQTPEASS